MNRLATATLAIGVLVLGGCGPLQFIRSDNPPTAEVPLHTGITPDQAYDRAVEIVSKRLPAETAQRGAAPGLDLVRSAWTNTWAGTTYENYKFRAEVRFNRDKRTLIVKCDAQEFDGKTWHGGWSDVVLSTLETELHMAVGPAYRACPG